MEEERIRKRKELQEWIQQRYPVLDITIEGDLEAGAAEVFTHFFPKWDRSKMHLHQFTDGITNKLYKVVAQLEETPRGEDSPPEKTALVRIYGERTEVMIDRESELTTLVCLGKLGLCSPLYGRFNNGICYGFVEGKPFTPDDMKAPEKFKLVAHQLALFHAVDVFGERKPALFNTLRKWLLEIPDSFDDQEKNRRLQEQFSMKRCVEELEFLEEQLSGTTSDVVFCHNDLLSANILYQAASAPDAKPAKVRFIDYEYGNYNWRAYDIANHFCEMMGYTVDGSKFPTKEFQLEWLRAYIAAQRHIGKNPAYQAAEPELGEEDAVSQEDVDALYEEVKRFTPAPSFHWGVWALVQARYSSLETFDYIGYSSKLFERYHTRKEEVYGFRYGKSPAAAAKQE
ncbi:phosphotransferase enzyme domain containing protein [Acanthamoeba castellanii str. Neff]|uniref:ethanolamine kinase n=1 Tax=Acanthamoeba castellanii (strain ATCC 30010 / Neff) TaxID=1257118 RepID=L8GY01_ACACF|nr:phosphotransferase enzyme domain containing protein [Acanthamoeba castellanii str. Neff]ELR18109.1 phosphotransferase enzyme domain containing protein [Acanthamoeba castellanii str. Neff]